MKKHTPGPWKARPFTVAKGCIEEMVIDSGNWKEMAIVFVQEEDGDLLGDGEANARVMAAAPELLAALEGLLQAVDPAIAPAWEPIKAAHAAIAKARGQG